MPRVARIITRPWVHEDPSGELPDTERRRALNKVQLRAAVRDRAPSCAACDATPGWAGLYRCFQCDLWLCRGCASDHFPDVERR